MLLINLFACFTSEYAMACEHAIEYSPKSIYVCVSIDGLSENLLWRWSAGLVHAIDTFAGIECVESSACIEHAYYSEIRDEQVVILPDENAVRCEIAMQYCLLMGILKRSGNLIQVATGKHCIHWPFLRESSA